MNNINKLLLLLMALLTWQTQAQVNMLNTLRNPSDSPFHPELKPFYHGVASGDPLTNAIIIWTRVTPDVEGPVSVNWQMATDTAFMSIVKTGNIVTDAEADYTVKVDVTGLQAGKTYYYRFETGGIRSITGRTKTAAQGNVSNLKFGVISCNNYQSGYFNAFGRLAERNDLDVILHLGDFIYEYATGEYGYKPAIGREHDPDNEVLTLGDYRTRYSHYRLDDDLRRAMQQHPFVLIWDDHEVANDSYDQGAENHDPATEGTFADRKSHATQAYLEWCPIRETPPTTHIYRKFTYGDLADVIMLDTRHEGRTIQADSFNQPNIADPSRTLISTTQMTWLKNELLTSNAKWKVLGNQVIFSPLILAPLEAFYAGVQNQFLDIWQGYPAARKDLMQFIADNNLNNVFFSTGDVHISLAFDVTETPADTNTYKPATGMGSIAVECVTTSITSDNYDEYFGTSLAGLFETLVRAVNPHVKLNDFMSHGYYILDLNDARAQADYYYVPGVATPSTVETFYKAVYTNNNENYLQGSTVPSPPKVVQELPAPDPTMTTSGTGDLHNQLAVFGLYPNPVSNYATVNYALQGSHKVKVVLSDVNGREIQTLSNQRQGNGIYELRFNTDKLNTGIYFAHISLDGQIVATQKFVKN